MKRLYILLSFLIFLPSTAYAAKKHCAELLAKLHTVQAQQRQGHSFKQSIRLREKEDNAREKWWKCENTRKPSITKNKPASTSKKLRKKPQKRLFLSDQNNATSPVFSSSNIVIKHKYKGEKLAQWFAFYQRPKQCAKPKTTQVFAYCMEHKSTQQALFEKQFSP